MGGNEKFTYAFSTVPAEILTGKDIAAGVLEPTPVPVYFTLITSMFMHDIQNYIEGKTRLMNSVFGIMVTATGIPLYYYFRWKYKGKADIDVSNPM